jgi:general secretion pathway protein J
MNPRSDAGFTLIEVLVALTLLAMLSVGLVTTFRTGHGAYARVVEAGDSGWNVVIAQRSLRRLLESTYPFEPADGGRASTVGLQGDRLRLTFSAPMPLAAGGSGHYRYEVGTRTAAGGRKALVVRSSLDRNGMFQGSVAEEVILEDIEEVEWGYLDAAGAQRWRDDWSERRPPALVRLRVSFPQRDSRSWPDLIVAPRISDDANCAFDVVSQSCREAGS